MVVGAAVVVVVDARAVVLGRAVVGGAAVVVGASVIAVVVGGRVAASTSPDDDVEVVHAEIANSALIPAAATKAGATARLDFVRATTMDGETTSASSATRVWL